MTVNSMEFKRQCNWLSWSYFGYFAVLALIVPYLAVYLDALGFNSRQIGELIAIATACRILGPPLWATISDRMGKRLPAIRLGVIASFLFLLAMAPASQYWTLAILLGLLSLFWSAILPQLEVVTLGSLGEQSQLYSRIRAGGSAGFVVISLLAAEILAWGGKASFPLLGAALMIPLLLAVMVINEPALKPIEQEEPGPGAWARIFSRKFLFFLGSSVMLQASFAPFYAFFALYLTQLGYAPFAVGAFIALGVVAEIVMFLIAGKLVVRFQASHILAFCLLVTMGRWLLLSEFATVFWWLVIIQFLHAFSFALHHSAAMRFVHRYFPERQHSRGQAMYVSIGFGGGGAIGAWLAGITWQQGAGAEQTFILASTAAAVGALFALLIGKETSSGD